CRYTRYECRFTNIGITDQSDVGEQFQLETKSLFFACCTILSLLRSAIRRRGVMRITMSTASTVCNQDTLIRFSEIVQQFSCLSVVHCCPDSNADLEILTVAA